LLQGTSRAWCTLGVVRTPPAPSAATGAAAGAWVCQVELVPDRDVIEVRVMNPGQGLGKGLFVPWLVGDEVLVFFPDSDRMRAVALGGFGAASRPNPIDNTGAHALLLHPGGAKLQTTDGQPLHGLVHGQFLAELAPYLTAFETFMTTISTATTAPQIATAALTFLTGVSAATPVPLPVAPSGLAINVAASAGSGIAPGVGGPPHATSLHKASP
jgi:hypothetical protein